MSLERNTDDCPADLIPTRKSLLGRLKDLEDNESSRHFFNTYWRLIYAFAIQRGLNHEDEEWQKNLMDAVVQRVKRRVSIEQYQMFDLFVLEQWPACEVARTLGVTIVHVYLAKHRLSKLIRKEFEALEANGV
jgi:hypothetical protein